MNLLDRARLCRVRCLALVAQSSAGARPTRGQVIRAIAPISDELAGLLSGLAPWESVAAGVGSGGDGGRAADPAAGRDAAAEAGLYRGFAVEAIDPRTSKISAPPPSGRRP